MSKNREIKEQVVADIVEKFKGAESVIVCSYSGLTVEQVTNLRKQCRENDVQYCVLKNRLVKRALEELNINGIDELLEGPNAFIFSTKDVTAGPKTVSTFIEKNKLDAVLKVTGGLMGADKMDMNTIKALATMPSRDELLAQVVGCLTSHISGLVAVLDQIADLKSA